MFYRRHLKSRLEKTLLDSPVVLLNGARQVGKSTLAQRVYDPQLNAQYINLDAISSLSAARSAPEGFIDSLGDRVIIDEVQRAPELFLAIKRAVDANRVAGRFLLTGSTNALMVPKLVDPLVGRVSTLTLWPLSQGEIRNAREMFVDFLFDEKPPPRLRGISQSELIESAVKGGYPEVLRRTNQTSRAQWFEDYTTTILQKDVRELSQIEGLIALPNLLQLLAARTGSLLNTSELTRTSGIANTTLKRYLALLQAVFLVHYLPAWSVSISKRVVKSPKLYIADTGLAAHLQGIDESSIAENRNLLGPLLENFVVMELLKQSAWSESRPDLYHFRTQTGHETDIVLRTRAGKIAAVEIKAASAVKADFFAGMKLLRKEAGKKFQRGIVLYTGNETVAFEPDLVALPVSALWEIGEPSDRERAN